MNKLKLCLVLLFVFVGLNFGFFNAKINALESDAENVETQEETILLNTTYIYMDTKTSDFGVIKFLNETNVAVQFQINDITYSGTFEYEILDKLKVRILAVNNGKNFDIELNNKDKSFIYLNVVEFDANIVFEKEYLVEKGDNFEVLIFKNKYEVDVHYVYTDETISKTLKYEVVDAITLEIKVFKDNGSFTTYKLNNSTMTAIDPYWTPDQGVIKEEPEEESIAKSIALLIASLFGSGVISWGTVATIIKMIKKRAEKSNLTLDKATKTYNDTSAKLDDVQKELNISKQEMQEIKTLLNNTTKLLEEHYLKKNEQSNALKEQVTNALKKLISEDIEEKDE